MFSSVKRPASSGTVITHPGKTKAGPGLRPRVPEGCQTAPAVTRTKRKVWGMKREPRPASQTENLRRNPGGSTVKVSAPADSETLPSLGNVVGVERSSALGRR